MEVQISSHRCTQVCVESRVKATQKQQKKNSFCSANDRIKYWISNAGTGYGAKKIEKASNLTASKSDGHKLIESWNKEASRHIGRQRQPVTRARGARAPNSSNGEYFRTQRYGFEKYKIAYFSPDKLLRAHIQIQFYPGFSAKLFRCIRQCQHVLVFRSPQIDKKKTKSIEISILFYGTFVFRFWCFCVAFVRLGCVPPITWLKLSPLSQQRM